MCKSKLKRIITSVMTMSMMMTSFAPYVYAKGEDDVVMPSESTDEDSSAFSDFTDDIITDEVDKDIIEEDDLLSDEVQWQTPDETWYEDYEYTLLDNCIYLNTSKDSLSGNIVVPGKAMINGNSYDVVLDSDQVVGDPRSNDHYSLWRDSGQTITGIKIENGVKAKECTELFAGLSSMKCADLNGLVTESVTSMNNMFYLCLNLQDVYIDKIDTSNVQDMSNMFSNCEILKTVDVSHFNTSNVKDMHSMFSYCDRLENIDVSKFDTSKVERMDSMFHDCEKLKQIDVSSMNTSNVTNMSGMFSACFSLNSIDVSSFDTSNVTDMSSMFYGCQVKSLDLSNFDTSKVNSMAGMFANCSEITSLDLSSFDTSNVDNISNMFSWCLKLKRLDMSSFDLSKVYYRYGESTDGILLDNTSLEYIKTPKITNFSFQIDLPVEMYELLDDNTLGSEVYTDLAKAPMNSIIVSKGYVDGPENTELSLDNLIYSFDNTFKSFSYPAHFKIPLDSYIYLFGDNVKAKYLYKRQSEWRGNCMGFSGTSALMFDDDNGVYSTTFSPDAAKISDLTPTVSSNSLGIDVTRFIEVMQISQKTEQIASEINNNRVFTFDMESGRRYPDALYDHVKSSCAKNEPVVIAAWQGGGGHALLAYNAEDVSDSESRIYVYDSNKPEETVYITLNRDESGHITSWRYDMGGYGIWGTDSESALSYVPYTTINEVWKLRGRLGETKNTASFNTKDFTVFDAEDNLVATVTDGVLNTDNSEIFMLFDDLSLDDVQEDEMVTLVLPVDVYTIKNDDTELDSLHLEVVDNMQGMTVDTTADKVVLVVADDYGLNSVQLDAAEDDSYSISLDSSIEDDIASVCVTGTGSINGELVEISQNAGEVSLGNGVISSLIYDGEEMITYTVSANAGYGGTIDPAGSKTIVKGTDQLYTITPDEGYEIADVLVDGVSVGAVSEYLFSAVDKDHTIEARFFKNDMHMVVGEKQSIKLVKGQNAVKEWIVDNENVVKLSSKMKRSCKVTGLAEGLVCITGLDKNKEVVIQKYLRIEKPVLADQVIGSGEEFSVSAFISGSRDCIPTKYSSSKSSVLKIDKKTGVAKAKKNGTAKISVWYGNAKYTAKFEVKMPVISEKKTAVKLGETKKLEIANALDGAEYRWESSKESIVTVSEEGVLTPVKKGKAKITMYYTINGKEYVGSSCTITIKK